MYNNMSAKLVIKTVSKIKIYLCTSDALALM